MSVFSALVDILLGGMFFFYGFRALTKGTLGESTDRKLDERYTPESIIKYKKFYAVMAFLLGIGFLVLGVLAFLNVFKIIEIGYWTVMGVSFGLLAAAIITLILQYVICKKKAD